MNSEAAEREQEAFEVAIEETQGTARRLTISVPPDRVARSRQEERLRLARSLNLKGFRKGKVPPQVVEQRFGEVLDERSVRALVDEGFREAVERYELQPVGTPSVRNVRYARGERLTFEVEVEVMPSLSLERIGGFKVKRPDVQVTDAEVDRVLEELREERVAWEPVDRPPAEGDLVSVRIAPAEGDGSGGEAKPYRFRLGDGQAIPDVEAAIRSLSPGAEGTFEVEFPEGMAERERAGTTRRLQIELVSVAQRRLPELTDAFAAEMGEYENLQALRAAIREDLLRHADQEAERAVRDQILDLIGEANPFTVPKAMVDDFLARAVRRREGAEEARVREAREALRPHAEREIRRSLIVDHLIEREGLTATPEEVEARVREIATRGDQEPADVRRRLVREKRLDALARQVAVDKLFDYLKTRSAGA